MLCREGDQEPEYFRGEIFGDGEAWTRSPDDAYQFLKRRAAVACLRVAAPGGDSTIRIVPVFIDAEIG